MKSLLMKWEISTLSEPDKDTLGKLDELRTFMTVLIERISEGNKLGDSDIDLLNKYMTSQGFFRQLTINRDGLKLKNIPIKEEWSWFISEVAASFIQLYLDDRSKKLKACNNPECKWFFIDESKNSNRKWCDETCASLMKVRRFRQKNRNI